MARRLSELARTFLNNEARARAELTVPLLVLETTPTDRQDDLLLATSPSLSSRQVSGEGTAFLLQKSASNAFPMGITIGRTTNNDVVLADNSVSRFHAWFQHDPRNGWRCVDADSRGGTFVDGERLQPQRQVQLPEVARLRFGGLELFYFEPAEFFEYLQGHLRPR